MLDGCFCTDWLLVGQSGISFGLPSIVSDDFNSQLSKSAVHLKHKVFGVFPRDHFYQWMGFSFSYPNWANMFKKFSHFLLGDLVSQTSDVDCVVLRVILLLRASYTDV